MTVRVNDWRPLVVFISARVVYYGSHGIGLVRVDDVRSGGSSVDIRRHDLPDGKWRRERTENRPGGIVRDCRKNKT